jgi:two-component system cell cycle response regulator
MNIRVLLVESEPEDVIFLKEALEEIESERCWKPFVAIELVHAPTWSVAAAILTSRQVDLVLLDPDLPDSRGIDTFRRAQATAPQVPVILLTAAEDDEISIRMIREGAQDFLLKRCVDCGPLAHAMRNAIDRQRLLNSARAASITDSLTGLPNRSGFTSFADRDRKLAERLGRRLMILLAEPKNLAEVANTFGEQRRDLALVEAADRLRGLISPTDLVARIGEHCFAMVLMETNVGTLESSWARVQSVADSHQVRIGAAIFDPDHPVSLDTLLDQAAMDLAPSALVARN